MQMAPRRHPGAADTGDILAHLYGLPDVHRGSAVDDVPVGRLVAAVTVVADTDVVAITAMGAREQNSFDGPGRGFILFLLGGLR